MTVYLVGAGPGDPGLLTVRGAEVLATADVVIHDRLSVADLLELAPAGAELVDVGTSPTGTAVPQDVINELLVEHGRSSGTVVRLEGGDPFVFARGAEECEVLARAGIHFEVVPGVTSAIAAPSAAGVPITLRDSSTSFTVVAGDEDPTTDSSIDWEAVARLGGTIVVMGAVGRWSRIAAALEAGGLAPDTPAAAVSRGTQPRQVTVRATLATIGDNELATPSTIVVGEVAAIDVGWFEQLPLFGRRIVVTRTRVQASSFVHRLRRLGAEVVQAPAIEIGDPDDGGAALRAAVAAIDDYDWLVLTSPNGADRVCGLLRDARVLAGVEIAAIGPGTAAALRAHNIEADLIPRRFVAEGLLEAFPEPPAGGGRVLLARAAEARDVLPEGLAASGWHVDVVTAYRTAPAEIDDDQRERIAAADTVTFTSSSTVTNTVDAIGVDALPPVVACIGPITAATARSLGLEVAVEADVHTIDGLIDALCAASTRPGDASAPG